jgi:hypothetical protein
MARDAVHERQQQLSMAFVQMVEALGILDTPRSAGEKSHLIPIFAIAGLERDLGRENPPSVLLDIAPILLATDPCDDDPNQLCRSGRPPSGQVRLWVCATARLMDW